MISDQRKLEEQARKDELERIRKEEEDKLKLETL
jgi:hypothetical protein